MIFQNGTGYQILNHLRYGHPLLQGVVNRGKIPQDLRSIITRPERSTQQRNRKRSSVHLKALNTGARMGRKKTGNVIMNRLSMTEKPVVQKSSSRHELQFLGNELANAQRRRETLRLTMVVAAPCLAMNASLLPPAKM